MTRRFSPKQRLLLGTMLAGAGALLYSTTAWAACDPDGAGTTIVCSGTDADGYQTSTNGVTIDILSGANVGVGGATPSPLLSTGGNSALNNNGIVDSGATAVSMGAGSSISNSYYIGGDINFSGGDNSLTNGFAIAGDVIAGSGNDVLTNDSTGTITGDIGLGDGNNTINNAGTIVGNITTGAGNDTLANTAATGTVSGDIDLGSGSDTISNLVGTGTVTKSGAGTLTLSGNNGGFSNAFGTTTVLNLNGGTVSISSANGMFNGGLTFDGGALQTTGAITLSNSITLNSGGGTFDTGADLTLSQPINGSGALTKTGAGNLTLGGANTYSGGTTISGGTLTGTTTSLQGNIVDNAALVFDQNFSGTYAGDISGTGSVARITSNTVTFTGNNTYSGATLVDGGVLAVGGTGIGDSSAVSVNSAGTLQLNGDETIGSLSGDGALFGGFTLTTGGNNGTTGFSGTINGLTGIDKVGTGTLSLTGTGTLTNGFLVNGGTLAIGGNYSAPASTVASGGTLYVLSLGTITGNVSNSGAMSGTGTVVGAVTNSGTLSPGINGIGTFNVDGSYAQTTIGALAIQLRPAATPTAGTDYDQLLVTGSPGTATLDGTLALAPASGLYVAGTTYDVVRSTGGISGNFVTISGNVLSPFITLDPTGILTISGTEQVFRLTVTRTPFATGIGTGATPNQIATANGFQGLVPGASGDAATLVSEVDLLTATQARQFFDEASPEPYGAYARSLLNEGELFFRQVSLETDGTPALLPGFNVWARGYGLWGHGRNQAFRFGSDIDTWGLTGGVTYSWSDFYIGAAAGASTDKVHYKLGNSNGHNNGWQGGVYGGYDSDSFSVDLQLDYIHAKVDATRSINVAGIVREAAGHTDGHELKFVGTAGYNFDLSSMKLKPFVGLDYTTGKLDPFTETGAGAANLSVERIRADRSDLMLGFHLEANRDAQLSPYGRVVYRHNLDRKRNNITAFFNDNAATQFTVSAVLPARDQIDVDAGLNFRPNPNLAIFAGYQGTFRGDLNSHGVSAGLSYSFGAAPPPSPPSPTS